VWKATVGADDLEPGRDIISFRQGVRGREKPSVRARHYRSLFAEKSGTRTSGFLIERPHPLREFLMPAASLSA
jgi:hypothetical protein